MPVASFGSGPSVFPVTPSPTLYILIGPPGVGKTTYCTKHMRDLDVRVSMDDIQQMMGGEYGNYRPPLKHMYQGFEQSLILGALSEGHDVWLDRTNVDMKRRHRYFTMVKQVLGIFVVGICFPMAEINDDHWYLARRLTDDRGISKDKWLEVIQRMIADYETPTISEPFNKLIFLKREEVED